MGPEAAGFSRHLRPGTGLAYPLKMRSSASFSGAGLMLTLLGASLFGCGSDAEFSLTANVAGNYTVSVTNADNGCLLDNWEVGASSSDIPFVVTQQGSAIDGTLQGLPAVALGLAIGTNMFSGTASGEDFALTAYGTISHHAGNCTYTLNAAIDGHISGDAISGTIAYSPATSQNPDCASVQCTSTQNFNGTRPPQ
jgi:hypothetical protein